MYAFEVIALIKSAIELGWKAELNNCVVQCEIKGIVNNDTLQLQTWEPQLCDYVKTEFYLDEGLTFLREEDVIQVLRAGKSIASIHFTHK